MPVTAKFSEKFYERLGHELTDELVNHLNFIDHTYRTELRELNELNFARFDAKIEQRAMQLDAKWEQRFAKIDQKVADLRGEIASGFAQANSERERSAAERRGEMGAGFSQYKTDLIKWMFVYWAGTTVTVVGTMIALVKL